ncbi:MAG TPA: hypothetical protein VK509_10580, partial [Polyangiales bacterium]|nr:hypothetical protein [Polyangiales bacterium]
MTRETTWSELERGVGLPTDTRNTLQIPRNYAEIIECDERQFLPGSSVLLPQAIGATDERELLGLSG